MSIFGRRKVPNLNSNNLQVSGNVSIDGNLAVSGTTTETKESIPVIVNSLVRYGDSNDADTTDNGIYNKYVSSGTKYRGQIHDSSAQKFKLITGLTVEPSSAVSESTYNSNLAILSLKSIEIQQATNQIVTGNSTNLTTLNFPAPSGAVTLIFPSTSQTIIGSTNVSTTVEAIKSAGGFRCGTNLAIGNGSNVRVGFDTNLNASFTGQNNVSAGCDALSLITTAVGCVAIGKAALQNVSTGGSNTAMGISAGANNLTTGISNTFVGANTQVNSSSATNRTLLGANVTNSTDNTTVIGDTNTTSISSNSTTCTLGTTALPFSNLYSSGSLNSSLTTNQIITGTGSNLTTSNFPASSGAVTITYPNTTSTLSTIAGSETLINKTITSPTLGGTISLATGTVIPLTLSFCGMIDINAAENTNINITWTTIADPAYPNTGGFVRKALWNEYFLSAQCMGDDEFVGSFTGSDGLTMMIEQSSNNGTSWTTVYQQQVLASDSTANYGYQVTNTTEQGCVYWKQSGAATVITAGNLVRWRYIGTVGSFINGGNVADLTFTYHSIALVTTTTA